MHINADSDIRLLFVNQYFYLEEVNFARLARPFTSQFISFLRDITTQHHPAKAQDVLID
jgi:hypothetical protein